MQTILITNLLLLQNIDASQLADELEKIPGFITKINKGTYFELNINLSGSVEKNSDKSILITFPDNIPIVVIQNIINNFILKVPKDFKTLFTNAITSDQKITIIADKLGLI
jgi:hypothetical protein